jgi:NAD(P)-dependent dehydrogenase (short-subunit alcohol dehydrogenase family)
VTAPLAGRVAVVTGGTGGIGSAVCRRLADNGAVVVVGFRRDESAARSLVASLSTASGNRHAAVQTDVNQRESLARFAQDIGSRYEAVDVLVNCVGTTRFVPHADLDGLDDDLIDEIFKTNWRGPFATIRALKPLFARSALVVNISSVAAITGIGSNVAYCASKAALNAMTVSLARALAPAVRVVSVSPGVVETDFIKGLDESWRTEQAHRTPLGRLASPEDVADAVLAAATTLRYSTGCIIPVDGGRPLA